MKNKFALLFIPLLSTSLIGCNNQPKRKVNKDISIVYTTDVHCGIDNNLGYSSLYAYKEELKKTNYVTLVDAGDYLQGNLIGAISNGEYLIEMMNAVEYDIVTLGNHEFDYGMDVLHDRLTEFNGEITSCNFTYIGDKENKFEMVEPYIIKNYGYRKIGFIGVTTPTTLVESNPKNFYEDDKLAYDFGAKTPEDFYSLIQKNIDDCKEAGADYIIALSHLGSSQNYEPYSSIDVISNTSGVLAFLDGHCHANIPWEKHKNKNNEDVLLVDTGYQLNEFASLTISESGKISYEFVTEYSKKSTKIDSLVEEINEKVDKEGDKVVATIDVDLSITDDNGVRMIRNREMPIGNLVADAYKVITSSEIAFINGGGVRANLKKGDVTYKDIKGVNPFGNTVIKKKTTGAKILDYLEFASREVQKERVNPEGTAPVGENGEFAQVSGLKFDIDTSIPSSVIVEEGSFVKVDGPRRVKNVKVLKNDTYVDIDANKEYEIASIDFIL